LKKVTKLQDKVQYKQGKQKEKQVRKYIASNEEIKLSILVIEIQSDVYLPIRLQLDFAT